MIVDSSALLSVLLGEADATSIIIALDRADQLRMSAPTRLEVGVASHRKLGATMERRLDELVSGFRIEVVPFDEGLATIARAAYRAYGRGSGHRAHLNFGDCYSYALAKHRGEPLLFIGDDFVHTDLISAL